jgi:hypothetical protein
MLPDHFYDERGNLKSFRQRTAERANADRAAKEIAIRAAAQAPKREVSPYAARIDELKSRMEYASPSEARAIQSRLTGLTAAHTLWLSEREDKARIAALQADPLAKLAIEHATALERSFRHSHPNVDEHKVRLAVAIAQSTEFQSPADLTKAYWAAVSELDATQRSAEESKLAAALESQARSNLQVAQQELRTAEARLALARSSGALQ